MRTGDVQHIDYRVGNQVVENNQQDAATAVDVEPAEQDGQGDHLQQEESQERDIFQDGGNGDVPHHPEQGDDEARDEGAAFLQKVRQGESTPTVLLWQARR